jgi:tetratricopeptide (TPR) repeat protein
MDNNLGTLEYKFKICTTIEEYHRALDYFEKIVENLTEINFNDIEVIIRLKKGLVKLYKRYIQKLKNQDVKDNAKGQFKMVLDHFTDSIYREGIATFEKFIKCINILFYKSKDEKILAVLYSLRGALFSFMVQHHPDRSKYLELALANFKKSVDMCMMYLDSMDLIRLKIFHSYIKFIANHVKDIVRAYFFCSNIIEEIDEVRKSERLDELVTSPEFLKIEEKFKNFSENRREEYNRSIGYFHPEYKNL